MGDKSGLCLYCGRYTERRATDGLAECDRPDCNKNDQTKESVMDRDEFLGAAVERQKQTKERLGQAMFNLLYEIDPDTADAVRGTLRDPFYSSANVPTFLDFVFGKEA